MRHIMEVSIGRTETGIVRNEFRGLDIHAFLEGLFLVAVETLIPILIEETRRVLDLKGGPTEVL